ncbi:hypothetical protein [Lichenibacterium dinghuense]|uniref:hypothetical protein n=1 Tax=Lichenibacterium dinghuense TaxID=2895977 RepID=UPI001F2C6FC4|nr:hypothetical protein [Lichenibacterium sp. 6Y81]
MVLHPLDDAATRPKGSVRAIAELQAMGVHPEFSSFDRRPADLDAARRTMWQWAEPIVIDRAVESYVRTVDEAGTAAMARKHCRLWQMVLFNGPATVMAGLDDLQRAADSLGLPEALVDDTNDHILEELVDIVTSRYRSSRNTIRTFSLVLMAAASSLSKARISV